LLLHRDLTRLVAHVRDESTHPIGFPHDRPFTFSASLDRLAITSPLANSPDRQTRDMGKTLPGSDRKRFGNGDPSSVSITPRQPVVS
jgi:hypothetical protein